MDANQRQNGSQKRNEPWSPTPRQLEIYKRHSAGERQVDLAKEYGIAQSNISKTVSRVANWLLPQMMKEIREIKVRNTTSLRNLYAEVVEQWHESKNDAVTVTEGPEGTVTTRKGQTANPAYVAQAVAILDRIAKLWGADVAPKAHGESEYRYAGKSREQVIRERIDQLQGFLESEQERNRLMEEESEDEQKRRT